MIGIMIEGSEFAHGDNQSVLCNTRVIESTIKKKSQGIAFHLVREGVARDGWRTTCVDTNENETDLLTKPLPNGEKRKNPVWSGERSNL